MAEKLLLHMQYECSRYKIDLPWDSIAHRLHPGSSGGAIIQHLNRLRNMLVAEGHLVPPICQKPGSKVFVDPKIRGYVRKDIEGPDTASTRAVPFTEEMDDRKFNLPDAYDDKTIPDSIKRDNQGGGPRKPTKKKGRPPTPDPLEGPSDGDYDPMAKPSSSSSSKRRAARALSARKYVGPQLDEEAEEEDTDHYESFAETGGAHYYNDEVDREDGANEDGTNEDGANENDADDEDDGEDAEGSVDVEYVGGKAEMAEHEVCCF